MSLPELPKTYDPQEAQRRFYPFWLEKGYFHAPDDPKRPYCIVIPPPNVTGALHLGHALNNTLQDILIRWKRMQGFDALWMPGTDHAGIATQAVVERRLKQEEGKTRRDVGREGLVQRIWAWKDEYEKRILGQLREMGCSCDWDRIRFTLDEVCARAVRATFFRLFAADKIYRGKRLVNWDTHLQTAVADDEIESEPTQGHLWTIRYPVTGSDEVLQVSTTRPETMLGDTAVAVHPSDSRYQHLIGKTVTLPLMDRPIPIIADAILVNLEFGTGCVKVTPAHDPNDYACGVRNGLPMINLLNPDGTYNENAGIYAGLPIKEVRKRVVADLEARGLMVKVEPHALTIPLSDRSKTPIEPYLSDQWFVRMGDEADGSAGFASRAMEAVTSGAIKITPERYAKSYLDWLGEKRDWCISRQLWWGHRIPVWRLTIGGFRLTEEESQIPLGQESGATARYLREVIPRGLKELQGFLTAANVDHLTALRVTSVNKVITIYICSLSEESDVVLRDLSEFFSSTDWKEGMPPLADKYPAGAGFALNALLVLGTNIKEDEDVLDTWFSSALWPHSTLGWPEKTTELAKYYPTSVLSTARDIITLWVARMVIFGQFNMNEVPFKDVFIHPVIQDGNGKRMSKSAGNGIDPVDIIELYGADALRYSLAISATETQDLRMPVEPVKDEQGRIAIRRTPGGEKEWIEHDKVKEIPKDQRVNTSERFEQGRTFPNKFWNAARFALMNLEGHQPGRIWRQDMMNIEDRWILHRLEEVARATTSDLNDFKFAESTKRLRDFTWNDFCDWYIEAVKPRLRDPVTPGSPDQDKRENTQRVLATVLDGLCRLLHPVMPFVTEQVWVALNEVAPNRGYPEPTEADDSVCIAEWPVYPERWKDPEAEMVFEQWQEKTAAIRNLRAEHNIPREVKISPIIVVQDPMRRSLLQYGEPFIRSITNASIVQIVESAERPDDCAVVVLGDAAVILPLAGLIDKKEEAVKLKKQLGDLDKQLGAIRAKLGNEGFASRAPTEVVEAQKAKEAELSAQRAAVAALLGSADRSAL